jgi:putative Holliday junction resolvase
MNDGRVVLGMKRVLGVDLGSRRIGIACSDAGRFLATPYSVIARTGAVERDHERILAIARECEADLIVVGLPTSMNGTAGTAARAALAEAEALRAVAEPEGIAVVMHDERMTTNQAQRVLIEGNVRRAKRKELVDKVAAAFILQSYLDGVGRG